MRMQVRKVGRKRCSARSHAAAHKSTHMHALQYTHIHTHLPTHTHTHTHTNTHTHTRTDLCNFCSAVHSFSQQRREWQSRIYDGICTNNRQSHECRASANMWVYLYFCVYSCVYACTWVLVFVRVRVYECVCVRVQNTEGEETCRAFFCWQWLLEK